MNTILKLIIQEFRRKNPMTISNKSESDFDKMKFSFSIKPKSSPITKTTTSPKVQKHTRISKAKCVTQPQPKAMKPLIYNAQYYSQSSVKYDYYPMYEQSLV